MAHGMMLLPGEESEETIPSSAQGSSSWMRLVGGGFLALTAFCAVLAYGNAGSEKGFKQLRVERSTGLDALQGENAAENALAVEDFFQSADDTTESNQTIVEPTEPPDAEVDKDEKDEKKDDEKDEEAEDDKGGKGKNEDDDLSPGANWKPYNGWPCREGEELFFGHCYKSCDAETNGTHPNRNDDCTCCMDSPCISGSSRTLNDCARFDVNMDGERPMQPLLPDCPYANEEIFEGLCYTKCTVMTKGLFPFRTAMNTCSNGKYGGNWTMGFGPCSGFGIGGTKCAPHIPMAAGTGYSQELEARQQLPGRAPLGFKKLPEITAPEVLMKEVPAKLEEVMASTPLPGMAAAAGSLHALLTGQR